MNLDSIRLLEECSSGIQMAITAIDEVLPSVHGGDLRAHLEESLQRHHALSEEADTLLAQSSRDSKKPPAAAKGMARLKTGLLLTVKPRDSTVADLMVDGCNMGVKSVARYLNRFESADVRARELARQLIGVEDRMACTMRPYL